MIEMEKTWVNISDVLFFQEGPGVRNTQYTTSGVKLLNVANLVDGKVDLSTSDRYISEDEAYGKYSHFLCDVGDFIVASSGIKVEYIDKKMGFIEESMLPLCMNTSTIRFKVLDEKLLRIKYFMYYLKSQHFKGQLAREITGSAQLNYGPSHLKKMVMPLVDISIQDEIVQQMDKVQKIIDMRQMELSHLDDLIKARFVEMFGDPIINSKNKDTQDLKDVLVLKAGDFTAASDISEEPTETNIYPCYGGNGIRGYVADYNQEGEYSLVGRQGALSGNVQYAEGKFRNTEHALLVTPIIEMNSIWLNQLLINLDLKRYQTGAAQPGLSVKNLQEISIIMVSIDEQNRYADFVKQVDKSKVAVLKALDETQILFDSLMQEYFG